MSSSSEKKNFSSSISQPWHEWLKNFYEIQTDVRLTSLILLNKGKFGCRAFFQKICWIVIAMKWVGN